jgi:hypothetical protein
MLFITLPDTAGLTFGDNSFSPTEALSSPRPISKGAMPTWKKASPRHNNFDCCAARHLWNKGPLALAVYDFIGGLTSGGKTTYFSKINRLSKFLGSDYEATRRAFSGLVKHGWLARETGLGGRAEWRYVTHDAWAKNYAEECITKEAIFFQESDDPFVGRLYALASGNLRLVENYVKGIRKLASDEAILERFRYELEQAAQRRSKGDYERTGPRSCFSKCFRYFKECSSTVENPV